MPTADITRSVREIPSAAIPFDSARDPVANRRGRGFNHFDTDPTRPVPPRESHTGHRAAVRPPRARRAQRVQLVDPTPHLHAHPIGLNQTRDLVSRPPRSAAASALWQPARSAVQSCSSRRFESCRGHYLTSTDVSPCEIRATRVRAQRHSDSHVTGSPPAFGRVSPVGAVNWFNPSTAHQSYRSSRHVFWSESTALAHN